MDSTTLVLPGHAAEVHPSGSLLINPVGGLSDMAQIIETATGTVEKVDVDPVTLDLIENGLRNARYEMDEVLFRTALSPGIREQHDEFPLIGDPEGKMVVGQFGLSIPDFLDGLRRHRRGGRRPADVGPLRLRGGDQPRQRLADRRPDLQGRPGRRAGRRCSGTCPTSAARRRRPCPPTRAPSTRRASSSRPSSSTARASSTRTRCGSSSTRCASPTGTAPTSTAWSPPAAPPPAGWSRCATGSAPPPTSRRSTRSCSATTTP